MRVACQIYVLVYDSWAIIRKPTLISISSLVILSPSLLLPHIRVLKSLHTPSMTAASFPAKLRPD